METTPTTADQPTTSTTRFRRTRIAVSVVFGVLTLLLVVLWVRSYWISDYISIEARSVGFRAAGVIGLLILVYDESPPNAISISVHQQVVDISEAKRQLQSTPSLFGIGYEFEGNGGHVVVPIWISMLVTSLLSIALGWSQCPKTFSIRTMLIITTLVAVGLGALVWAAG